VLVRMQLVYSDVSNDWCISGGCCECFYEKTKVLVFVVLVILIRLFEDQYYLVCLRGWCCFCVTRSSLEHSHLFNNDGVQNCETSDVNMPREYPV
jgi:hypothetical protein